MSTFYTDHWKEIEPERLSRYETMFQYRVEQAPLLEPLNLESAKRVLDFGCGPGFMVEEIASRIQGEAVGADLNSDFIERAIARNDRRNLSFIHLSEKPLADQVSQVDRVFCKNVLEYVPDHEQTLRSFFDVLAPGGEVLLVDSDWGFLLVEPWGKARTEDFFSAAGGAFREPQIGRKLSGSLARAGFTDIGVRMLASVDLRGWGLNVLTNMCSYIRQFDAKPESELEAMMEELKAGLEDGSYMFVLPQFIVTAKKA